MLTANDSKIVQHNELPEVTNEVSITLRLNIISHDTKWACVFHKGGKILVRTPSLWLSPTKSVPRARFSSSYNLNVGIEDIGNGLLLNKWYHLAYTLSDSEKRLDFYLDGEWAGFHSIQPMEQVIFNAGPLYIGNDLYTGITGQISNFRYFNWRLSADEVTSDYLNKTISIPVSSVPPVTPVSSVPPTSSITSSDQSNTKDTKSNPVAIIVGVGIGASLGSILIFVTGFYLNRSYKKRQKQNRAYDRTSDHQVISSGK
ncbi:hypothetical protein RhiirA5_346405 [Rhizophagus irregularis]|uniref:Concanavalin A-like lectin/glucanase n=1 Tax=Rhizophagus irregularis TaxID=588596 RepID=A0A2N0QE76_9GLOM|nr:hypothetical protein RhiirA5_346405 [Rhizophagus irregularis]